MEALNIGYIIDLIVAYKKIDFYTKYAYSSYNRKLNI